MPDDDHAATRGRRGRPVNLRDVPMTPTRTIHGWSADCRTTLHDVMLAIYDGRAEDALEEIASLQGDLDRLRLAIEPHVKEEL